MESGGGSGDGRGIRPAGAASSARPTGRCVGSIASRKAQPMRCVGGVVLGHDQVPGQLEDLAQGRGHHAVGGDAADEEDRRLRDPPLGHAGAEIAGHGFAQPAEHLRRQVSLLLGVDHVALGEDRAAPGDLGRPLASGRDLADVLDRVLQPARPADRGTIRFRPRSRRWSRSRRSPARRASPSGSKNRILEDSPPISNRVRVDGAMAAVAAARARNSFSSGRPSEAWSSSAPEPVTRTPSRAGSAEHLDHLLEEVAGRFEGAPAGPAVLDDSRRPRPAVGQGDLQRIGNERRSREDQGAQL